MSRGRWLAAPAFLGMGPTDLNDSGLVVGTYLTSWGFDQKIWGFLYDHGIYSTLHSIYTVHTLLGGMNEQGDVAVIQQRITDGAWEGAIYTGGAFVPVTIPAGSTDVLPSDVNDAGQHVGYHTVSFARHGYFSDPSTGAFLTIDYPSAAQTNMYGLNDQGLLVGTYILLNPNFEIHPITYDLATDTFVELPVPQAWQSYYAWPTGINNAGVVVATLEDSYGVEPDIGAIWDAYGFRTFEHPDGDLGTSLTGINEAGQLCGTYRSSIPGNSGSFIATPVP